MQKTIRLFCTKCFADKTFRVLPPLLANQAHRAQCPKCGHSRFVVPKIAQTMRMDDALIS